MQIHYQPVVSSDGLFSIHEIIKDKDELISVSYEPVRLQASCAGELDHVLRQVYRHMQRTKPITEDELDSLLYKVETTPDIEDEDDNVIDLVDYFSGVR